MMTLYDLRLITEQLKSQKSRNRKNTTPAISIIKAAKMEYSIYRVT